MRQPCLRWGYCGGLYCRLWGPDSCHRLYPATYHFAAGRHFSFLGRQEQTHQYFVYQSSRNVRDVQKLALTTPSIHLSFRHIQALLRRLQRTQHLCDPGLPLSIYKLRIWSSAVTATLRVPKILGNDPFCAVDSTFPEAPFCLRKLQLCFASLLDLPSIVQVIYLDAGLSLC